MSFIEEATLKVVDQSSAPLNKINAELKRVFETAKALRGITLDLKLNDASLRKGVTDIRRLTQEVNKLRASASNISIGINTGRIDAAAGAITRMASEMRALRTAMAQPVTLRANTQQALNQARQMRAEERRGGTGIIGGVALGNLVSAAAYSAATHVLHATTEGTRQLDIGETSLKLKQLATSPYLKDVTEPETVAKEMIKQVIKDQIGKPGGPFMNIGQTTQLFSETFGTVNDMAGAKKLTASIVEMTRAGVALGQNFEVAFDKAYSFAKAADMMGRLAYQQETVDAAGKVHHAGEFREEGATPAELRKARARGLSADQVDRGMNNFFEYLMKAQPEIGKEMTGPFTMQMAKYLAATRYGVSNRAFGSVLLMGEEYGTKAALMYSQAVKQFSGVEQTNERLLNLTKLGILQTHMAGKRVVTDKVLADPALLQTDLPQWAFKNIANPEAMKKVEAAFGRKFDLSKIEDAQDLARRLVGNRNAIDQAVGALFFNAAEIQRKLDVIDARKGDPATIRELTKDNVALAIQTMTNQIQGTLGEGVKMIAPTVLPMMQNFSEFMAQGQVELAKVREGKQSFGDLIGKLIADPEKVTAAIVGGGEAYLGYKMYEKGMGVLAGPLGSAAAAQGMMSPNAGVRTLSFAGQSLISAADALKGAAAAMNPFAALPRTLPPWLLGGAAATGAYFWSTRGAGGPSNMPELEQLNRAMQELEDSTKHVSAVQGELAKATDPEVIKRLNAELRQAQERQAAAKEQVAKTGAEANIPPLGPPAPDFHELPPTQAEYERALQWEKEEREAERRRAEIQRRTRGRQDTTLPPPSQIPLPRERPSFAPPVPPVAPLDLPPSLTLPSTTELEKSSRPTDLINLTSVDEASARFEAAFGTGSANITSAADSLSAAGAAAASIIASGASAAGSAYGAAAAAQISAAAANVHINVTQSGGRPDPGAQKTD